MQMSVLPYNLFTVHAARFGLGFQGLLFSLALADRYRILRRRLYKQEREANEVLERKVQERTEELHRLHQEVVTQNEELHQTQEEIMAQRDAIEVKNQELATQNEQIQNSIRAAKAIQKAIVPHQQKRDDLLKDYFVIYRPRDVVSGDIYWLHKIEDSVFMAVIDCTGHGVPGAFMTMITHNLLDKIVRVWDIHSPSEVLNRLHEEITTVLRQKETDNNYGMDMSFTTTMPQQDGTYHIVFAGAKQNAYYVQEGEHEVKVLQGVRKSIGGLQREDIEFTNISLNLTNGSQLYLSTDGYIDQNDLKRKRIGEKAFIQLLQDIHQNDMYTQKQLMIKYLYNYMRDTVQRDDILVLGIKLDNREN
jgi:serine phosphatase RsbU (regulator of sigma subunit)